ncbi:MAG: hypothetical protein ACI87E_000803 [Mariniblastus sp.]|jgi:hypothetical protein
MSVDRLRIPRTLKPCFRWQAIARLSVAILCGWVVLFAGQTAICQSQGLPARIDQSWDKLFTTRQGWTGGDGGGTVDLGNGRVLWMFADSFVGGVADGKHSPGSHMINNAFAVQSVNNRSEPKLKEFDFSWGPLGTDRKPTAWLVPDPFVMSPARKIKPFSKPHGWFWPAGGGCVVEEKGKRRLFVFMFHMGATGETGVWGFENIGGAMAVIEDHSRPIGQWKVRQIDLPFTKDALREQGQADVEPALLETNWGLSCVGASESGQHPESAYLYVYGDQHSKYKDRELLVARVRPGEIEDFGRWEFFSGTHGWVRDVEQVEPIATKIGAEFSIEKVTFQGQEKYVMVHSHHLLGTKIFIRTADAPEGPWTKPRAVYEVPDVKKSKNYFTYAARGHAMVSPEGQLLITYIVNSNDFWEMAADASIYRPRCITVPLELIFGWE